jgi:hypothetical protein
MYDCLRCGCFFITRNVLEDYFDNKKISKRVVFNISGWIRENSPNIKIGLHNIERLLELRTPDVYGKSYKLLNFLYKKIQSPGDVISYDLSKEPEIFSDRYFFISQKS